MYEDFLLSCFWDVLSCLLSCCFHSVYHNLTHSNNRVGFAVDSEVFLWNVTLPASQASKLSEFNTYDVLAVSLNTSGNRIAISRECEKDNIEVKII